MRELDEFHKSKKGGKKTVSKKKKTTVKKKSKMRKTTAKKYRKQMTNFKNMIIFKKKNYHIANESYSK